MRGRAQIGLAVVLLAALACKDPATPKKQPDPGPTDGIVRVPTNPGAPLGPPTSATVGPPGGGITSADGRLVMAVPAGAVASPTEFTITPVANTARGGVGGSAFRLRPEGSTFAKPITLTFKGPDKYPAGATIAAIGVEYQDVRGYWHRAESVTRDAAANTLTVTTDHFSDWATTWQSGIPAMEGPILLTQNVGIPFTAAGRASIFLQQDEAAYTAYVLTGTLTVPSQIQFGGKTCTPDQVTKTLDATTAEAILGATPLFRWGLTAVWTLTCTDGSGAVSTHYLRTLFDTLRINLLRCPGTYGPGQVVSSEVLRGTYTSDCGIEGSVTGTWDLKKCIPDEPCDAGVCRDGKTVCTNGIASCEDRGPAPDGTLCGADNLVCSIAQCVDLLDPLIGIHVTPTSGLLTTEAGGTATYTVVLGNRPTIDVVVGLSTASGEGSVNPQTVTFTPLDWDLPQTVTVTGLNDFVQDGNQLYVVASAPAVSIDPRYTGLDPEDVSLTNLDDDVAGIKVVAAEGLSTSEPAGIATFTVELTSQPLADVSLALSSSDTTEGVVSPLSLSFSALSWNVPQTVTVTGRDDAVVDGAQPYSIVTAPAFSTDPLYNAFDAADVILSNADNDTAGITVQPTGGLQTTEAGTTATFTVALRSEPVADVVIPISSLDPSEGSVSPASLTFTALDWNVAQTVTVTGVNDDVADGTVLYDIVTLPASSTDLLYVGMDAADVSVSNVDDDFTGVTVNAAPNLTVTEAGSTATFTVALTSEPTADVSIGIASSDTTESTAAPATLLFNAGTWSNPQTVTITGVNDFLVDLAQVSTIRTAPAASADVGYQGLDASDVTVTTTDDDVAGIAVAPTTGLGTTEAGGTATFTIVLGSEPTADVTIALTSADTTEATVSPASVTFTSANWSTPQTVTVTGANDAVVDGAQAYTILTAPAVSADANYNGRDAANVTGSNADDDTVGIAVTPTTGLTTTEAGGTATFTIVLGSEPTATVTIPLTSSDTTEGTVSPASVPFTAANWNVPQTVTITGVNDQLSDFDRPYQIVTGAAASTDPLYAGFNPADVSVTNTDDDLAGILVTAAPGLSVTEVGGSATFSVVLASQPSDDVTIALSSSDTTESTVAPATLTFNGSTWDLPQTVTVTGVDDLVADGNQTHTIVIAASTSTDPAYQGIDPADVAVTTTDDDLAGVTVTPTTGLVTTEAGGTATFTIRLSSEPTANVSIPLSSSDPTEGSVSPSAVVFTTANWSTAQTVTVTGANDALVDGAQAYTVVTGLAVSTDAGYGGRDASDVSVSNTDDDVAGISVTPTSGLVTTEAGGTATFTVVLAAQPTSTVAVSLTSSDATEGAVAPASVSFTAADWNTPKTVTVTGVNDLLDDGDVTYTIQTATVTTDPAFVGVNPADVSVTNTDDDAAGVSVTPTSGLTTTEAGGTASFTIVLAAQPSGDVTIPLSSSDTTEGSVLPASVTFTNANWNVAQTVTVTGVNDDLVDGAQAYSVLTGAATSADAAFSGFNPADVSVSNADNDAAGVNVTPVSGLTTTEAGGTATFTIVLGAQPSANVTIALSSSDTTEGSVAPTSVTFTNANWNVAQTVTVTGVNDELVDGSVAYTIVTAAAVSTDAAFSGFNSADVSVTNADNDAAGVNVTPVSGLTTTEAGGTASFTIVLGAQPSGDVTIPLSSSDTTEGTVSPTSVTFTNGNWNVAQTVTVTGANDELVDGSVAYTIVTAAAVSTDAAFSGFNSADVSVTNADNDAAGVNVTPVSGLTTTEAGGTASFTIVLGAQPSGDVAIALSSSDTTEGSVFPASVTFTNANWNVAQTVTVTGVNDDLVDGAQVYSIVTAAATSADAAFNGLAVPDVSVSNADNDAAGINVTPVSGLTTTEAGGTATFTIVLGAQPSSPVTIPLSSSDLSEGTVSPASVTFTNANWNVAQTITVTGVNDELVDGAQAYSIVTEAAASIDAAFDNLTVPDVSVSNADNDAAGVNVTPVSGLTTTEAGGTATFTIVLGAQPSGDVSIALSSSDTTEGAVLPALVTFTNANWNVAQTVTVTGVNDDLVDGAQSYSIVTGAATSADAAFNGLVVPDVSVSNADNDAAGINVTPVSGLTTTEAGGAATFTIVLGAQPSANVTIALSSSDLTEGTVLPASVTFTNANWNVAQTVTVTGVNDELVDGAQAYSIVTGAAASTDVAFDNLTVPDVSVSNADNDAAGINVTPVSGLTTTEGGGTATFTIVLGAQPSANVTIALSSSDTSEGTVLPASVTFTNTNWNVAQTITVTGVNDDLVDGAQAYSIVTGASASADAAFNGLVVPDVSVSNADNDAAGVNVTPVSGLTTTEAGGTATFTIVLGAQPSGDVAIALSSSDTSEGTVLPASVTFTNTNWSVAQTVTVTGVNDDLVDGAQAYSIVTGAAASADAAFNGLVVPDVSVSNADNDAAGISVTPVSGLTTTEAGGTATFTIVLGAQPSGDVSIALSSGDTTEGTVSPASVTFTNANWDVAQTVTVTGVNDDLVDGAVVYTIVTAPATGDAAFLGVNAADVSVTNSDNDAAAITVTPTSGLTTTEAGGTATFTIVLGAQPATNVSIGLSSNDTAEGTVLPASVTFTNGNWNVPQTVTVTGVDDAAVDGAQAYTIITAPATGDAAFLGVNAADVSVTNSDNDAAAINVTPTSGLTTTEAGGTATFTIVLGAQPATNVSIALSSSDTGEGTVLPASVTFTNANWNLPQTVTVTGVDDLAVDGPVVYAIVTAPATGDAAFLGVNAADVSLTNGDNDAAAINVTPTAGLTTTEAGGTATFTIVLGAQPGTNVSIALSSTDTGEGTVLPASVTFTNANWNVPQTVTVTGADDVLVDGPVTYTIVTAPATGDAAFLGVNAADVGVTNSDNDAAAINVTPPSGLTTTEAGGTATFTVVLGAQPATNVAIALSSGDITEGSVSPASVTFTNANWNVPQTVTVTGVDDVLVDGPVAYTIVTAPATGDAAFLGVDAADVSVTNTDNDAAAINVTPTSGLTTTEAGGTATFTIVLGAQPTTSVSIALSSGDTGEGTVLPASVTFSNANWNVAQTVTVTGVDDVAVDGAQGYAIITASATGDPAFAGLNPADVSVTNSDNDAAAINVTPTSGLTTTEAGGAATFTIVLGAQPVTNVSIGLSSSDTTEGTVLPVSVTFTNGNWNVPQTVTVTGVDDVAVDGSVAYTIVTAQATGDAAFAGFNAADVAVTNTDDDAAGVTVTPTAGLVTSEAGGTDEFTVVLTAQPTADVTVQLASSDTTEGTVSPPSVTFTAANWSTPQTVTATGEDDGVDDGDVGYTILTTIVTTAQGFTAIDPADVSVTNTDDDAGGILVTPISGLVTTEVGGTAGFTIALASQPDVTVTISLSSTDTTEGTVSPPSVTFTPSDWSTPKAVTVTGVNDAADDGDLGYTIQTNTVTSDPVYVLLDGADVAVTNTDDDAADIVVTAAPSLQTTEGGGQATFTIVLSTQPSSNVSIGLSSSSTAEGAVLPATVTFTSSDWSSPKTVTVTGVDDPVDDGNQTYSIVTAAATSSDPAYGGRNAADVTVTNVDDDTAGINVVAAPDLTTNELGGSATFDVSLATRPLEDVTIAIASGDPDDVTAAPTTLTFDATNWNIPQLVTVTAVDDLVEDGNRLQTILTNAASSLDPAYDGLDAEDVQVTTIDNDTAAIVVTPAAVPLVTTEAPGPGATFTVVLTSQPTGDVTIGLTSSDTTEGTVPAAVVFTTSNWNTPRQVTVTGVPDSLDDGDVAYSILTAASSADPVYDNMAVADVSATNTDDDVADIVVTASLALQSPLPVDGAGTFTVVLAAQPVADVTIPVTVDAGLGSLSVGGSPGAATVELTFSSLTWNTVQTVTVTRVSPAQTDPVDYFIVLSPPTAGDAVFLAIDPADLPVTNAGTPQI